MDGASDRMNSVHASKLRLVKDMRERSALRALANMEAKRRIAAQAVQQAFQDLATAEGHRARIEVEVYRQLLSFDATPVAELDRRCHRVMERLTAEIALTRRRLDEARIAQEQAETAVSETRALWAKCSAATHKWQQIETDVRRAADTCSAVTAEIDADDEVLLRYGRGSSCSGMAGDST
ncbi:hypothetical protein [Bradyrhizobium sp. USDA 10063]